MSVCHEPLNGEERHKLDVPPSPRQRPHRANRVASPQRHPFRTKPERKAPAPVPIPATGSRPNFSIEGYEILECRGKGGMGQVYRAIQKSLGREVAIKTLDLALARHQASIMRFTKEAAAMAHLRHPNIVQVIDRGSSRQRHYFIMEFVDGPCLRELLREGAFAPQEALQIMLQLGRTMAYAHKQGVVHRDLKPENILYTSDGVLKVADFGLAGVAHETTHIRKLTRSFVSMGTECYMAPEQRRDAKNVDFRADLYSMGVIFYELLTNQLPFPQMPPPHVEIAPGFPAIDAIIRRCLEPKIEDRYPSTEAFADAVEAALGQMQAKPVISHDTVIDTPAVEAKASIPPKKDEKPSKNALEDRLSDWTGQVQGALSGVTSHVSMSWQHGSLRRWAISGGSLGLIALAVALFFLFSPAPPEPKATGKELQKLVWKFPAQVKELDGQRKELTFSFDVKGHKGSWRHRPRQQWSLKGYWRANREGIFQNSYQNGAVINVRRLWAVYRGHLLESRSIRLASDVAMLPPMVPVGKEAHLVPLQQFIRQSMPVLRNAKIRPTAGLGLLGKNGQKIAFLLKKKGSRIAYTLFARSKRNRKDMRVESGFLRTRFSYARPLRLSLQRTASHVSAWVEGKRVAKIQLTSKDQWPAYGGLVCRDAHCSFKHLKMTARTSRSSR